MEKYLALEKTNRKIPIIKNGFVVSERFYNDNLKEIKKLEKEGKLLRGVAKGLNVTMYMLAIVRPKESKVTSQFANLTSKIKMSDKGEYIKSSYWKKKRKEYFDKYHKRCVLCGESDCYSLAIHHVTYARLGIENIDTDLVCLCNDCHKLEHQKIDWDINKIGKTKYLLDKRKTYR